MIRLTNVRLVYPSLRPAAPSGGNYSATFTVKPPEPLGGSVVRHDVWRAVYFNRIIELGDPLGALCWPSQVLSHPVTIMRTSRRWSLLP
jgi:hypothetical protein